MATEKQAEYIKRLISERKANLVGQYTKDLYRSAFRNWQRKQHGFSKSLPEDEKRTMRRAMSAARRDGSDWERFVQEANQYLNNLDAGATTKEEASRMIDLLKGTAYGKSWIELI